VTPKEKGAKSSKRSRISGPYTPYGLFQTKGEMCAKSASDLFRNVNLYKFHAYKQTNKHSFLYIRLPARLQVASWNMRTMFIPDSIKIRHLITGFKHADVHNIAVCSVCVPFIHIEQMLLITTTNKQKPSNTRKCKIFERSYYFIKYEARGSNVWIIPSERRKSNFITCKSNRMVQSMGMLYRHRFSALFQT